VGLGAVTLSFAPLLVLASLGLSLLATPLISLVATLLLLVVTLLVAALALPAPVPSLLATLLTGPVVALFPGLQILFAVDAAATVPTTHVLVLAELSHVGPSLAALLALVTLLMVLALLAPVVATLLGVASTVLLAVPADIAASILVLDRLPDSGLAMSAGLVLVVLTGSTVLATTVASTTVPVPSSLLAGLSVLSRLLVLTRLLVVAGLLDGLLVLGVPVADVLVGVGVVMLTRPLGTGSPRPVPAARSMSALLLVVAHLLVLVLSVTPSASPSAPVLSCHDRIPVRFHHRIFHINTGRHLTRGRTATKAQTPAWRRSPQKPLPFATHFRSKPRRRHDEEGVEIPARSRLRCSFIGSRVVAVVDGETAKDFESPARSRSSSESDALS
jgi:hypothetical protein